MPPDPATAKRGAALDAEIADLTRENQVLRALLNNGYLLVNDPANAFLSRELWSANVCDALGEIQGCMRRVHHA
jgi:hypothetical protein